MAKPTKIEKEDFLEEHLPYEISMLRATNSLLKQPLQSQGLSNALVESFCVHARNLIEFFKHKESCDFDPRWFADDFFHLNKRFIDGSVLRRITEQISHLTANRTKAAGAKINASMRREILAALEAEIGRWESHLTPQAKPMYMASSAWALTNSQAYIVSGDTTATNVIHAETLVFGGTPNNNADE